MVRQICAGTEIKLAKGIYQRHTPTPSIEDIKSVLNVTGILNVISIQLEDYQKATNQQGVVIAAKSTTNSMALNNANECWNKLVKEKEDLEQKTSNIQGPATHYDR